MFNNFFLKFKIKKNKISQKKNKYFFDKTFFFKYKKINANLPTQINLDIDIKSLLKPFTYSFFFCFYNKKTKKRKPKR